MPPFVYRRADGVEEPLDLATPPLENLSARFAEFALANTLRVADADLVAAFLQQAPPEVAFALLSSHLSGYDPARTTGYPLFHEILLALTAQWTADREVDPRWFRLLLTRFPEIPETDHAISKAKHPDKRELLLRRFEDTGAFPRGLVAAAARARLPAYAPVLRSVLSGASHPRERVAALNGLLVTGTDEDRPALRQAAFALLGTNVQAPEVPALLEALRALATEEEIVDGLRQGIAWRKQQRKLFGRVDKDDRFQRAGLGRDIDALQAALDGLRPPRPRR